MTNETPIYTPLQVTVDPADVNRWFNACHPGQQADFLHRILFFMPDDQMKAIAEYMKGDPGDDLVRLAGHVRAKDD